MNLKGFTLIELLVTVTVIGIAVAIAAPLFGTVRQSKELDRSYAELESLIKEANNAAITGSQQVSFAPEAYGIYVNTANVPVTIDYFAHAPNAASAEYQVLKTITFDDDMAIRAIEDRNGSVIENCDSGDSSSAFRYQLTGTSTTPCPLEMNILFELPNATITIDNLTNHETIDGYVMIVLAHPDIDNKNYIVGIDKATGKIYTKEITFSGAGANDDPFAITAINDDFDDLEVLNDFGNFLENFYGQ
jgi:prepilin-type N-terminal cleavage/methylation domain-containing protein